MEVMIPVKTCVRSAPPQRNPVHSRQFGTALPCPSTLRLVSVLEFWRKRRCCWSLCPYLRSCPTWYLHILPFLCPKYSSVVSSPKHTRCRSCSSYCGQARPTGGDVTRQHPFRYPFLLPFPRSQAHSSGSAAQPCSCGARPTGRSVRYELSLPPETFVCPFIHAVRRARAGRAEAPPGGGARPTGRGAQELQRLQDVR